MARKTFPRILLNTESIGTTLEFLKVFKNYGIQDSRFKNVRKYFLGILNLESQARMFKSF